MNTTQPIKSFNYSSKNDVSTDSNPNTNGHCLHIKCDKNARLFEKESQLCIVIAGKETIIPLPYGNHLLHFVNAGNESEHFFIETDIESEDQFLDIKFTEQASKYKEIEEEQKKKKKEILIFNSLFVSSCVICLLLIIANAFQILETIDYNNVLNKKSFEDKIYDQLQRGAIFIYADPAIDEFIYCMNGHIYRGNRTGEELLFNFNQKYPMSTYFAEFDKQKGRMTLVPQGGSYEIIEAKGLHLEKYNNLYLLFQNQRPFPGIIKKAIICDLNNENHRPMFFAPGIEYDSLDTKIEWSQTIPMINKDLSLNLPSATSSEQELIDDVCKAKVGMSFNLISWEAEGLQVELPELKKYYCFKDFGNHECQEDILSVLRNIKDGIPPSKIQSMLMSKYKYIAQHQSENKRYTFVSVIDTGDTSKNNHILFRISNLNYEEQKLISGCNISFDRDAIHIKIHDTMLLFFDSYHTITYNY